MPVHTQLEPRNLKWFEFRTDVAEIARLRAISTGSQRVVYVVIPARRE